MTKLGIIQSSARPNSVGGHVARWILDAVPAGTDVDLIDLGEVALPAFDEAVPPRAGQPRETAHGEAWAQRIGALDAAVVLTPQYNGSYPGQLKNAIDWLYAEWNELPVALVGYGWGAASEVLPQLETLLTRVGAEVVGSVGLGFREDLSMEGEVFPAEEKAAALRTALEALTGADEKAPAGV